MASASGAVPSSAAYAVAGVDQPSQSEENRSAGRPPTLYFPSLHLGSFHNLTPDSFPSPTGSSSSPRKVSPTSPSRLNPLSPSLDHMKGISTRGSSSTAAEGGSGRDGPTPGQTFSGRPSGEIRRSSDSNTRRRTVSSSSSPPDVQETLPPVPSISPITFTSPIGGPSWSAIGSEPSRPTPGSGQRSVSASSVLGNIPTLREPPERLNRPLGHSLTIHIPPQDVNARSRPSPSLSLQTGSPPPPVLKTSPGLPRRRTIVEAGDEAVRASPIRMSQVMDSLPIPDGPASPTPNGPRSRQVSGRSGPEDNAAPPSKLLGQPMTSEPTGMAGNDPSLVLPAERTPQDRRSSAGSPSSPTPKRSLPKPPRSGQMGRASAQDLRAAAGIASQGPSRPQQPMGPAYPPPDAQTWTPVPNGAANDTVVANMPFAVTPTLRSSSRTPEPRTGPSQPSRPVNHQQTKSASTLPVVAGLMDAGPYPTATNPDRRSGQSAAASARQPAKPAPQEEICLECMMRDRDLADVIVSGEGIWDRASDADWAEMAQREQEIMRSTSIQLAETLSHTRSTASLDASSEETTSASPRSTSNSSEDQETQRRLAAQKRKKDILRQKRKEVDVKVNNLGWRGFKWEEGSAGEGFPKGFRGNKGGALTEAGIKAVMTKFPSASAHRYNYLQGFLRNQYQLVQEVAAEAQRLGYYPAPSEVSFQSYDSEPCAPGGQSSSSRGPVRGTYRATPGNTPPLGNTVRSSPSTPADLASIARGRPAPIAVSQRPMTHFIVDREPPSAPMPGTAGVSIAGQPMSHLGSRTGLSPTFAQANTIAQSEILDDDMWTPPSPQESGMRPFSFAVRAGAAQARGGSEGHGRRSILGRWGGSVTSFFGGSQAGSGSMIDMHLGLDNERGSRASAANVRDHPRAVSLASPTRPSFFSRDSRGSSLEGGRPRDHQVKMTKSMSQSRLSQMMAAAHDEDEDDSGVDAEKTRSKGLKGLLRRIKPKSRKSSKVHAEPVVIIPQAAPRYSTARQDEYSDAGTSLAPPPSMSFLAGGRRESSHSRSGSSSSTIADTAPTGQSPVSSGYRSVSAPVPRSSQDSQSLSPTSSRYLATGKRESSASGRRQSATLVEDEHSRGMYGTEVLQSQPYHAGSSAATSGDEVLRAPPLYNRRPHNKTNSSFSASSMVETPPPGPHMPAFFANHNQTAASSVEAGARGSLHSPDRYKNLPPLPGMGKADFGTPDSMTSDVLDSQNPDISGAFKEWGGPAPKGALPPRGASMASASFEYTQPYRPSFDTPLGSRGSFDVPQDGRYPGAPQRQGYTVPAQGQDPHSLTYGHPLQHPHGHSVHPGAMHGQSRQQGSYPHPQAASRNGYSSPNGRQAQSMYVQPLGPNDPPAGYGAVRPRTQYSADGVGTKQSGYAAYGGFETGSVKSKKGIKGWFGKGSGRLA